MVIIPELKKIAGLNEKIVRLSRIVADKVDKEGCNFECAQFISGCNVKGNHLYKNGQILDNCGLKYDLYYCDQTPLDDDGGFYGTLYFKTDVPGQYVAVPYFVF